ncbi:hypothetical protein CEXT_387841 [Caerostris extrusa]|uniref:Uncharacterized protein n=1 Tax=Caerostris extrusa TaxID=172846 RepID=A0AAV4XEV3_CAEEX|nr:hypothetical protein CEXT_387841 [Caerostris extrusa]
MASFETLLYNNLKCAPIEMRQLNLTLYGYFLNFFLWVKSHESPKPVAQFTFLSFHQFLDNILGVSAVQCVFSSWVATVICAPFTKTEKRNRSFQRPTNLKFSVAFPEKTWEFSVHHGLLHHGLFVHHQYHIYINLP